MKIPIKPELVEICKEIRDKGFSEYQWAEIESCDMFQSDSFVGGYDADENEFCFSYYDQNGNEYWFQFNLKLALEMASEIKSEISGKNAE